MSEPPSPDPSLDAIAVLTADHRRVESLWKELSAQTGDQARLVDQIVKELSIHDGIEKQVLYPAVRSRVEGGVDLADRSLTEHQTVEELLAAVEKAQAAGQDDVLALVRETMSNVMTHVSEEEGQIFPALRAALSADELDELGAKLQAAKAGAPTHPHPGSPNSGIGAKIGGLVAGMVDRGKDAVVGRPAE